MNIKSSMELEDRWTYLGAANSKAHCVDENLRALCGNYSWCLQPNLLSSPHESNRCKKCEARRLKIQAKLSQPSQEIKDVITQLINNSIEKQ
jgi:hypothetical protein